MSIFWLVFAVTIGVLQVCTAIPISDGEENDVTKIYSASELQRAKNAGIRASDLYVGRSYGLTFEEMMKLAALPEEPKKDYEFTLAFATKVCEILVPNHKSAANVGHLKEAITASTQLRLADHIPFVRTSLCAYLSQPSLYETEASSFGLQLAPYLKFNFFKLKKRTAPGVERVHIAKKMCRIYQDRDDSADLMHESAFSGFSDEVTKKFDESWAEFETTNTSKSFKKVCDFLRTESPPEESASALGDDQVKKN